MKHVLKRMIFDFLVAEMKRQVSLSAMHKNFAGLLLPPLCLHCVAYHEVVGVHMNVHSYEEWCVMEPLHSKSAVSFSLIITIAVGYTACPTAPRRSRSVLLIS